MCGLPNSDGAYEYYTALELFRSAKEAIQGGYRPSPELAVAIKAWLDEVKVKQDEATKLAKQYNLSKEPLHDRLQALELEVARMKAEKET